MPWSRIERLRERVPMRRAMSKHLSIGGLRSGRGWARRMKEVRPSLFPREVWMKPALMLHTAIVVAAAAVAAPGQNVRPESLAYMSRLFRLDDIGPMDNPRYSRDGKWLAFDARSNGSSGRHIFVVAAKGGTPVAITAGSQRE